MCAFYLLNPTPPAIKEIKVLGLESSLTRDRSDDCTINISRIDPGFFSFFLLLAGGPEEGSRRDYPLGMVSLT